MLNQVFGFGTSIGLKNHYLKQAYLWNFGLLQFICKHQNKSDQVHGFCVTGESCINIRWLV